MAADLIRSVSVNCAHASVCCALGLTDVFDLDVTLCNALAYFDSYNK